MIQLFLLSAVLGFMLGSAAAVLTMQLHTR